MSQAERNSNNNFPEIKIAPPLTGGAFLLLCIELWFLQRRQLVRRAPRIDGVHCSVGGAYCCISQCGDIGSFIRAKFPNLLNLNCVSCRNGTQDYNQRTIFRNCECSFLWIHVHLSLALQYARLRKQTCKAADGRLQTGKRLRKLLRILCVLYTCVAALYQVVGSCADVASYSLYSGGVRLCRLQVFQHRRKLLLPCRHLKLHLCNLRCVFVFQRSCVVGGDEALCDAVVKDGDFGVGQIDLLPPCYRWSWFVVG